MIELYCKEDLDKYGETRLVKCLNDNPKWRYDQKSTMFGILVEKKKFSLAP